MSQDKRQPVEYRVKEKSLIGNDLKEAGEKVFYDGLPSENLEPLCDVGRARAAEYEESNRQRVSGMIANNKESAVGDPTAFVKQFADMLAQQKAEADERFAALQQQNTKLLAELLGTLKAPVAEIIAEQKAEADAQTDHTPAPAAAPAVDPADAEDKPAKRTKG